MPKSMQSLLLVKVAKSCCCIVNPFGWVSLHSLLRKLNVDIDMNKYAPTFITLLTITLLTNGL